MPEAVEAWDGALGKGGRLPEPAPAGADEVEPEGAEGKGGRAVLEAPEVPEGALGKGGKVLELGAAWL